MTRARLRCRILMQNRSVDCHCHFYSALGLGTRRGLTTLVREESKATYQPGRSQEQKQPRRSWCAKDLPPGRFWTTRTCPCQGFAQHTRTARRFSMSLHTRKGPQPNRFLPEGNATWGTVKCPSGRVGRAQKCATSAAMSATKTAAVVSVWRMRKLTLYAGIPSGGYHVSGASRRIPSANMQRRSLNNHPLTSTGGRADTK